MSSPVLRKAPGTPAEKGMYRVSGPLGELRPGRRVVKQLEVTNVVTGGPDGLSALAALEHFPDLRSLWLERVHGVDLAGLARTAVDDLRIENAGGLDLEGLSHLPRLVGLGLVGLDEDCRVPESVALPPSLKRLVVSERRLGKEPGIVGPLLSAIAWERLGHLRRLTIAVGDIEGPFAYADLGFLSHLPELEDLLVNGVRHVGRGPSPLVPPFDGLSTALTRAILEADDPDAVREALREHLKWSPGSGPQISVDRAVGEVVVRRGWDVTHEPSRDVWIAYGSLADAFGLLSDETEYDALRQARRRLRQADRRLLGRLDFDHEAGGTTIEAGAREDLERALGLLRLVGDHRAR